LLRLVVLSLIDLLGRLLVRSMNSTEFLELLRKFWLFGFGLCLQRLDFPASSKVHV